MPDKEKVISMILEKEWSLFSKLNNIGGRAECQDNKEDFILMRTAQWQTFNLETLNSYLEDLYLECNPLFQKYAHMMKYNMPKEYERVKKFINQTSESKRELVLKIMDIYMKWEEEFFLNYPIYSSMGRPLYSKEDDEEDTSIETYLYGELLSYSEKTLNLYYSYIQEMSAQKQNLAIRNMDNIAKLQGFKDSNSVEEYYKQQIKE